MHGLDVDATCEHLAPTRIERRLVLGAPAKPPHTKDLCARIQALARAKMGMSNGGFRILSGLVYLRFAVTSGKVGAKMCQRASERAKSGTPAAVEDSGCVGVAEHGGEGQRTQIMERDELDTV